MSEALNIIIIFYLACGFATYCAVVGDLYGIDPEGSRKEPVRTRIAGVAFGAAGPAGLLLIAAITRFEHGFKL